MKEKDIKIRTVFSKKSRKYVFVVVIVATIIMGVLDTRLQNQYGEIRSAYLMMDYGRYKDAIAIFEDYVESHSSSFWEMERLVNGADSEVGYYKVSEAIAVCKKHLSLVLTNMAL